MGKPTCSKATHIFVAILAMSVLSSAQIFTTLYSFSSSDGSVPSAPLVQGMDGNLYGTAAFGGGLGYGTVFTITRAGALTTLHSFCSPQAGCDEDGSIPSGGLVQTPSGNFYGTASQGGRYGSGTVYAINPGGTLKLLHSFCSPSNCADGQYPNSGLTIGSGGDLYGATTFGSTGFDGTVFKITLDGKLTTLHSFVGTDGSTPQALILGTNGLLYGTTEGGSINNRFAGTVFKMTRSGLLTTVYSFCSVTNCHDGQLPLGGLLEASNGSLWGTTYQGGAYGYGNVFEITQAGKLAAVHNFSGTDGRQPQGALIQATDGNLYGTTSSGGDNGGNFGDGTLFEITQASEFIVLHSFNGTDGLAPQGLTQATDGALYGTTLYGGGDLCPSGCGTIFKLDLGLKPFVGFVQAFGKAGWVMQVLGQGLTGTTSVTLNGSPVTFKVISDTLIEATVPAGATTGHVTVTTPISTLTSNVAFQVIP